MPCWPATVLGTWIGRLYGKEAARERELRERLEELTVRLPVTAEHLSKRTVDEPSSNDQALRWASVILYLLLLAAWLTVAARTRLRHWPPVPPPAR